MASSTGGYTIGAKRYDSVDCIMDKIDTELSFLTPTQIKASTLKPLPSKMGDELPVRAAGSCNLVVYHEGHVQETPTMSNGNTVQPIGVLQTHSTPDLGGAYEDESLVSVLTEDFENAFDNAVVLQSETRGSNSSNNSVSTLHTESFIRKFKDAEVLSAAVTANLRNPHARMSSQLIEPLHTEEMVLESGDDTETSDEFSDIELDPPEMGIEFQQSECSKRSTQAEWASKLEDSNYRKTSCTRKVAHKRACIQMEKFDSSQVLKLDSNQTCIQDAKQEKLLLLLEVSSLRKSARQLEETISQLEHLAKDNHSRAEEARSQLLVAEFKKNSITKDIEKLNADLLCKQAMHRTEIDKKKKKNPPRSPLKESPNQLVIKQFSEIIDDRSRTAAMMEQQCRIIQSERDKLEEQLSIENSQRAMECKQLSMEKSRLEQENKALLLKLEEAHSAILDFSERLNKSEARGNQLMEQQMASALEKTKECDELRSQNLRVIQDIKAHAAADISGFLARQSIDEKKLSQLQGDVMHKEEENRVLCLQLTELQKVALAKAKENANLGRECNSTIASITRAKDEELKGVKEAACKELNTALATQREQFEEAKQKSIQEYTEQIKLLKKCIQCKDDDISLLKQSLIAREDSFQKSLILTEKEGKEKVASALMKEREAWRQEQQHNCELQVAHCTEELSKLVQQLRDQYECERTLVQQLHFKNITATNDLEAVKHAFAVLTKEYEEKQTAWKESDAKRGLELEVNKSNHERETISAEIQLLKETLGKKERYIHELECQLQQTMASDKEAGTTLEKMKNAVIQEINDECAKTASILGVTPRRVAQQVLSSDCLMKRSRTISTTLSALANLRACHEELRNYIKELNNAIITKQKHKDVELPRAQSLIDDDTKVASATTLSNGERERAAQGILSNQQNQSVSTCSTRATRSSSAAIINAQLTRQLHIYLNRKEREHIKSAVSQQSCLSLSNGSSRFGPSLAQASTSASQILSPTKRPLLGSSPDGGLRTASKSAFLLKLQQQLDNLYSPGSRGSDTNHRSSSWHSVSLKDLSLLHPASTQRLTAQSEQAVGPHDKLPSKATTCRITQPFNSQHHDNAGTCLGRHTETKPQLLRLHSKSMSSL